MLNIKKLQENEFRFVLLKSKEKIPFESKWQTERNYTHNDERLLDFISKGFNYGVIGGYGNLIIIDFDDKEFEKKIIPLLPKTFTTKTGSGGIHKYLFCDDCKSFKILDKDKNTLADIQGTGKQVVGPGSTHPNGNKYEVVEDIPIATIKRKNLMIIFDEYLKEKDKFIPEYPKDNTVDEIKRKLSLNSLLSDYGYDTSRNPTACKLGHSSKGGACFSFKNDLWNCFHCGEGGDVFSLVMAQENCDFIAAKDILMEKAGIKKEKKMQTAIPGGYLKIDNYTDNVNFFFNKQPFFYDKAKIFWMWNLEKYCWEIVDETDILITIDSQLCFGGQLVNNRIKSGYLEAFKQVGRKNMPEDAPKTWVQFKNKIIDIKTNKIIEATPKYFTCNPIPWEIGKSKETPVIDKLFTEWVGEKYAITLKQILAYCCLQDYPIHRIFCFVGCGRNGKSQLQKIIDKFIGENNITSACLDKLSSPQQRFESSKLFKKLVCLLGETNFGKIENTSTLKTLTGGDKIDFEFKNKNPFNGLNYATIIVNSNSLPTSLDTSDGFYRRWMIIKFSNEFPEGKDIVNTIPEHEYNNLARQVVDILPELIDKGKFENEGTIKERKNAYIMASNPLSFFLNKCCDFADDLFVKSAELYNAYALYLNLNKQRRITKKEFYESLTDEGLYSERSQKFINGLQIRSSFVDGLSLKSNWKLDIFSGSNGRDAMGSTTLFPHEERVSKPMARLPSLPSVYSQIEKTNKKDVKFHIERLGKDNEINIEQLKDDLKIDDEFITKLLQNGDFHEARAGFIKIT